MKFPSPLLRGTLIKRYRRSLADIKLDGGAIVTAHVFALGAMRGCCEPRRPVLISDSGDRARRHPLTWELIDMNGVWVCVNPTVSRRILHEVIVDGTIESLRGYTIQSEAFFGRGRRIDLILQSMKENCFISVQSVSWAEDGTALFPDTVNEPARKSLHELAEITRQGHRAIAFFHVLRQDCDRMRPAGHVDKEYVKGLREAERAGVEIIAFRGTVSPSEIGLGIPIPFSLE